MTFAPLLTTELLRRGCPTRTVYGDVRELSTGVTLMGMSYPYPTFRPQTLNIFGLSLVSREDETHAEVIPFNDEFDAMDLAAIEAFENEGGNLGPYREE